MRHLPALLVLILLAAGVASVVWRITAPSGGGPLVSVAVPTLTGTARAGQTAFNANCATCHGENAAGGDKGPPLVHDIYNPGHHNDRSFYVAVTRGVRRHHWNFGDMKPQSQVTREDMAAIITYVRELQAANGIVYRPHNM